MISLKPYFLISGPNIEKEMATRDNPDPKRIIPNDQKRRRNATDRAQGLDSYFKAVEATAKPRQAQG
jgi:hypothetical protein